jgi:lipopolysaccharide transport system ATP-binding protein
MDPIIRVEGLSKRYLLRHQAPSASEGLRHVVQRKVSAPWRALMERLGSGQRSGSSDLISDRRLLTADSNEEFWALKDVSFEVNRGEVVGIIGRNGAGKSTLLKILSRITEPTAGRVEIVGRVASLLEVGTGFHPELTGRENIFVNGTILGMTRAEVSRKFDEIVAFAEIEKFLDTPVKRYSSGMYVRLAFAIAAHLEPEILIVDEVLAVGDFEFQKKCLGKIKDVVANQGRTVLFVSHNIAAIGSLCPRGLVLNKGNLDFIGLVDSAINIYLALSRSHNSTPISKRIDRTGSGEALVVNITINGIRDGEHTMVNSGDKLIAIIEVKTEKMIEKILPGLNLSNALNQRIATFWSGFIGGNIRLQPGINRLMLQIDHLDLSPGEYSYSITLGLEGDTIDSVENAGIIQVLAPIGWSPGRFPTIDHGPLFPRYGWEKHD